MLKIQREGGQLAYYSAGSGPAVLFIQGVGVHGYGWSPQVSHFVTSHQCLTFDNRGLGQSSVGDQPLTVEAMASDALAILDAMKVDKAHVVGHSLGGLVALQLAIMAKERVSTLALMCTFADGSAVAPLSRRMIWLGLRTQIGTRAMRQCGFLRLVHPPGYQFELTDLNRMSELFGHDLAAQPPIASQQMRAMRKCNLRPELHQLVGIPTMVLSAKHDPIAPPTLGRQIADGISGAEFKLVETASHGLPITHPEVTNQLLADHLNLSTQH